jgi:translation initiation factor IF-1
MDGNSKEPIAREEGFVLEALPALSFKVRIGADREVLGYLAGKMRLHHIRVLPGDRVLMEMSPDGKRGRIMRRL